MGNINGAFFYILIVTFVLILQAFRVINVVPKNKEDTKMVLHFNVKGEARKAMVQAIEKALGINARYKGMPSMEYEIGGFTVGRNGELEFEDFLKWEMKPVIEACIKATGITPEEWNEAEEKANTSDDGEGIDLEVSVPIEKVSLENLIALIDAKSNLMKKALGIENTFIREENKEIKFAWFKGVSIEEAKTYTKFISKLCEMSVTQKRVTAKAKENENEKYAFRCFLLRLGFIGDEYKADRKILLRNLEGSSAFKSGQKGGAEA